MVWLLLLFVVPLPLIISLATGLDILYQGQKMGINLGIYAYVWMLVSLYLSSRPKWIDCLIGLPDMYMIHGVSAIFIVISMYLHKTILPSAGLVEWTGDTAFNLFLFLIAYSIFFMASWFTNRVAILKTLKNKLDKLLKYELSLWVHRLNLVVIILIYVHIWLISYISEITLFMVLISLYTLFAFGAYILYVSRKYSGTAKARVTAVNKLDTSVVEIEFSAKQIKGVKSGDFIFVAFPHHKHLTSLHPFSVVNDPEKDNKIVLAVDGVGDFTKELSNLKVGEAVRYSKGYGILNAIVKTAAPNEKFVFIGGGIGITSLLSLSVSNPTKDIKFIYTARKNKKLLYQEQFENMRNNQAFSYFAQNGRLSKAQMQAEIPLGSQYTYIIAGPTGMNTFYHQYLVANGISKNKIYAENFAF